MPTAFWEKATELQKIERLKQNFNRYVVKMEGCWDWLGCTIRGYGIVRFGKNKSIRSNRASWILHNGYLPSDSLVLHKCDNPRCTNPDHLFLGSHQDNVKDMIVKGRAKFGYGKKLTLDQSLEIKKLIKENVSMSKIATQYGVHKSTIKNIKFGYTWR